MGRLTADPELRYTQSNIPVTSFSIACDRNFKNNGQKETDFFDIVAWRSTAEFITRYFAKGSMIAIEGRLQARKYTDRNNNNRVAVKIVADNVYFGDSKKDNSNGDGNMPRGDFIPDFAEINDDGDLPFDTDSDGNGFAPDFTV